MENYRQRLKIQNIFLGIGVLLLAAVQILAFMGIIHPIETLPNWAGFLNGFVAGAAMGIMLFFIAGLIMNLLAMRSEEKLKKHFVKEHDERALRIAEKGKSAGASVALFCMLIGGIIAGYFNMTVFIACIVCVLVLSLLMFAGKVYYNTKL